MALITSVVCSESGAGLQHTKVSETIAAHSGVGGFADEDAVLGALLQVIRAI